MAKQNIAQDLYDLLVTRNFNPETTDQQGQAAQPVDGSVFSFDYVSSSGKNYGTAVIVISDDSELLFFFGDNLGRGMEEEDKDEWFQFLQQLSQFATRHDFHTFSPRNLNQLKHTMAGMAAIKEGLFEGYYGTRRVSYAGEATEARLMIKHNRNLGENDARFRYVESLFVETAEGERFRLPFTHLAGGRAMLEHVRQGGRPYDVRGVHITEMISEIKVLSRFRRANQGKVSEGNTHELINKVNDYYGSLRESIHRMSNSRGYQTYFETWTPAEITTGESLVEDLRTLFVEQNIDSRIEAALPLLARIQGTPMKEAEIFETWANNLSEGTWALPDTPEAKKKLEELLAAELIVGPDATNATEQLYDIFGDDDLFDRLGELAERDADADARDIIRGRASELGIELTEPTPIAPTPAPEAPPDAAAAPVEAPAPPVAEGDHEEYKDSYEDDWDQEELSSGDYVRDEQEGPHGEIFIMRGDPHERRVRIVDKDGRGWNIMPHRLVRVDDNDPAIARYFDKGIGNVPRGKERTVHGRLVNKNPGPDMSNQGVGGLGEQGIAERNFNKDRSLKGPLMTTTKFGKQQEVEEAIPSAGNEYDANTTWRWAEKIVRDIEKTTAASSDINRGEVPGTYQIVINPSGQDRTKGYGTGQRGPGASVENISAATDRYFNHFRQKGWIFTQPVQGQFTIGVPKQQEVEEANTPQEFMQQITTPISKPKVSFDEWTGMVANWIQGRSIKTDDPMGDIMDALEALKAPIPKDDAKLDALLNKFYDKLTSDEYDGGYGVFGALDESKMSELDIERQDHESMTPWQFRKAHGMSQEEWADKNSNILKNKDLTRRPAPGAKDTEQVDESIPESNDSNVTDPMATSFTEDLARIKQLALSK